LLQLIRLAASRAACTAGNNSQTKIPMIAITTSNSTSVNAFFEYFTNFCLARVFKISAAFQCSFLTQSSLNAARLCCGYNIKRD
jgi:hypothetical protein